MLSVHITTTQRVKISISPVDRKGNAAALDGPAEWSISGPFKLTHPLPDGTFADGPTDDGTAAYVQCTEDAAVGESGTLLISADGDPDAGPDQVATIQETVSLTVAGQNAVNLGAVINVPEEIN